MALAKTTGTRPDSLYRILRLLASVGVFDELANRQFRNNRLSSTLSAVEHSVRHYARWFGCELHWHMYSGLEASVRTGAEFSELFAAAGLRLEQLIRTPTPIRLLEAVRAG